MKFTIPGAEECNGNVLYSAYEQRGAPNMLTDMTMVSIDCENQIDLCILIVEWPQNELASVVFDKGTPQCYLCQSNIALSGKTWWWEQILQRHYAARNRAPPANTHAIISRSTANDRDTASRLKVRVPTKIWSRQENGHKLVHSPFLFEAINWTEKIV